MWNWPECPPDYDIATRSADLSRCTGSPKDGRCRSRPDTVRQRGTKSRTHGSFQCDTNKSPFSDVASANTIGDKIELV
jgi:hypothetical protein